MKFLNGRGKQVNNKMDLFSDFDGDTEKDDKKKILCGLAIFCLYLVIGLFVALSFTSVGNFSCSLGIGKDEYSGYVCSNSSRVNMFLNHTTISKEYRTDYWYPNEEPCLSTKSVIKTVILWPVVVLANFFIYLDYLVFQPIVHTIITIMNSPLCWWP